VSIGFPFALTYQLLPVTVGNIAPGTITRAMGRIITRLRQGGVAGVPHDVHQSALLVLTLGFVDHGPPICNIFGIKQKIAAPQPRDFATLLLRSLTEAVGGATVLVVDAHHGAPALDFVHVIEHGPVGGLRCPGEDKSKSSQRGKKRYRRLEAEHLFFGPIWRLLRMV
jgi:hypothetical protein